MSHGHQEESRKKGSKESREEAERRRRRFIADLHATFSTESGKRVLQYYIESTGAFRPSFVPAGPGASVDPLLAALRDGRKSIILEIVDNLGGTDFQAKEEVWHDDETSRTPE